MYPFVLICYAEKFGSRQRGRNRKPEYGRLYLFSQFKETPAFPEPFDIGRDDAGIFVLRQGFQVVFEPEFSRLNFYDLEKKTSP